MLLEGLIGTASTLKKTRSLRGIMEQKERAIRRVYAKGVREGIKRRATEQDVGGRKEAFSLDEESLYPLFRCRRPLDGARCYACWTANSGLVDAVCCLSCNLVLGSSFTARRSTPCSCRKPARNFAAHSIHLDPARSSPRTSFRVSLSKQQATSARSRDDRQPCCRAFRGRPEWSEHRFRTLSRAGRAAKCPSLAFAGWIVIQLGSAMIGRGTCK